MVGLAALDAQDRAGSGQQATPATIAFEAGGPEHYVVTQADIASYIGRLYLLEIENAQLRAALADARAKVDSADLTAKGVSVQQRIRQILGCAADAPIEWKAFAPPSPGESAPSPCPPATAPTKKD